jgi:predicted transcriptional regulator of viral defense system
MAARGRLERIFYGVYRFPQWPITANDHLMRAVLWTRDSQAVLSHETVLDIWGLCDVNPSKIHLTIPKQRPLRRQNIPAAYAVHRENLAEGDRGWWEQIPTVTPDCAIRQGIADGLRPSLIEQAIGQALSRGLINDQTGTARRDQLQARFSKVECLATPSNS